MRASLFADVNNLYYCISKRYGKDRKLDYQKLLTKASDIAQGPINRALAYGFQLNEEAMNFINALRHLGFEPKFRPFRTYKNKETGELDILRKINWNVGLAMDVTRQLDRLEMIILCSSDGELYPLVEFIKERGVVCGILSCGIPKELKESANFFIEITEDMLEDMVETNE